MSQIEQIEMDHHRAQLLGDVRQLVEKYRTIFDWDIPDVDQKAADHEIVEGLRAALVDVAQELTQLAPRQKL
ncbi:MAG: hypothetical protein B7Y07_04540 [Halothiobacillus sp. 24-54-40]|jgi:hypothetical protein|nr:MAG: hypothetical protein B7Y58_04570 [Halothiobacillus sp. 35-54-62]OYZ87331.1 MAG: hypothetical protein B7Y07_04540 [Halothiobacillus sp. 24-54-40]OZA80490.1 MAG: hypothetical protein B7X64_05750 [Halothiobacillus sp. 39-53-45]HQS02385.1 hypothetical protein [Halothiobacillus sp.]HQS29295.1 hypothetical protein [Halothiobacillus sp.]